MAYPAKLWTELKVAYESGQYSSVDDLYKQINDKLRKKYAKFPTQDAIRERCTNDNWAKNGLAAEIEKSFRQKCIDYLASKDVKLHQDLMDKLIAMKEARKVAMAGESGPMDMGEDWQAIDKAITQLSKLLDLYPAQKTQTEISGEVNHKVIIEIDDTQSKI